MSRFSIERKSFVEDIPIIRCVLITYLPPVKRNAKHSSNVSKNILSNELKNQQVVSVESEAEDRQLGFFAFPSCEDRKLSFKASCMSPSIHSFTQTTPKGDVLYGHTVIWRREVRCEATIAISKLQRGVKYLDNEEELEKIDAQEKLTIPVGLVFLTKLPVHKVIQRRLRDVVSEKDVLWEIERRIEISNTASSLTSTSTAKLKEFLCEIKSILSQPICNEWTTRERVRFEFMSSSSAFTGKLHSEHLFVYRSNSSKRTCRFCKIEAFPIVETCWILSHRFGGSFSFHSMLIPRICSYLYELSCSAGLPEICVPVANVLEQVLPINLIALFTCVLLDIPAVVVSETPKRLTDTMESVLALLYPLPVDRLRVYVPLCPESTIRNIVQAPFPFIVGT